MRLFWIILVVINVSFCVEVLLKLKAIKMNVIIYIACASDNCRSNVLLLALLSSHCSAYGFLLCLFNCEASLQPKLYRLAGVCVASQCRCG